MNRHSWKKALASRLRCLQKRIATESQGWLLASCPLSWRRGSHSWPACCMGVWRGDCCRCWSAPCLPRGARPSPVGCAAGGSAAISKPIITFWAASAAMSKASRPSFSAGRYRWSSRASACCWLSTTRRPSATGGTSRARGFITTGRRARPGQSHQNASGIIRRRC